MGCGGITYHLPGKERPGWVPAIAEYHRVTPKWRSDECHCRLADEDDMSCAPRMRCVGAVSKGMRTIARSAAHSRWGVAVGDSAADRALRSHWGRALSTIVGVR
jgi:hypothetical protein